MKRILLALFVITLGVVACTDRDDELTTANIRIKNNSSIAFNLVEVIADSLFYENIAADGFSEYIEYEEAFEAIPFSIEADSANYNFSPAQQALEPLPIGLYTYEVTIDESGEVVLQFTVD